MQEKHTPVIQHDIGVLHQLHRLHGEQQWVTRPGAHKVYASGARPCSHRRYSSDYARGTRCMPRAAQEKLLKSVPATPGAVEVLLQAAKKDSGDMGIRSS